MFEQYIERYNKENPEKVNSGQKQQNHFDMIDFGGLNFKIINTERSG
jgi:hypothetical protein